MITMKKSWSVIAIIAIALVFGLLVGRQLFMSEDEGVVTSGKALKKTAADLAQNKVKELPTKKVLEQSLEQPNSALSRLRELAGSELSNLDRNCEQEFQALYPTDDFLDQESDVFSSVQTYDQGLMLLAKILDTVSVSREFDVISDEVYRQRDFSPNIMRTLMPHGVVCNDVRYTNFMHALVRSLGRDKNLGPETRRRFITQVLDLADRYVSGFKRMEYTFSAMEYLYALADNELIPNEYSSELAQIRQDIIRYTQDFEGEYRLENGDEVNRELLRTYRDANEQTNESIELLIDRIRADIPG